MINSYKLTEVDGQDKPLISIWERDTVRKLERCIYEDKELKYSTTYGDWVDVADFAEEPINTLDQAKRISRADVLLEMI